MNALYVIASFRNNATSVGRAFFLHCYRGLCVDLERGVTGVCTGVHSCVRGCAHLCSVDGVGGFVSVGWGELI
jgi:hypothetical protein